ncbi:MAG: hypothetical protein CMM93_05460 [Rickettsiales bacterium]|nr:hypothetical protein [Rickettsiales bacterium]|tara:strand:+ start:822 stop:1958 length:1137 start_codon:yes stop_codon:yes gene_type:complete
MSAPLSTVAILGLGQMGTSLALAFKKYGLCERVQGYDLHPDHATTAYSLKAVDDFYATPEATVEGAQLVVLCTPVGTYATLMQAIAPHLEQGAIITDIGSIKQQAIRDLEPHLPPHANLVPAHPIAGSEKVGPTHARADFFVDHLFLVTPVEETPVEMIELICGLWQAMGARAEALAPDTHDHIYAYVSHLPQLMAFATAPLLMDAGCRLAMGDEMFRRFTRIGRCDPEMWRDIFLENARHLIPASEYIAAMLRHMRKELAEGSAEQESAEADASLLYTAWPKLLASTLITTVQQVEHQLERRLLRYAAGGFVDFSAPILEDPEAQLAQISEHATHFVGWIEAYLEVQDQITRAMADRDSDGLLNLLAHCQGAAKRLL